MRSTVTLIGLVARWDRVVMPRMSLLAAMPLVLDQLEEQIDELLPGPRAGFVADDDLDRLRRARRPLRHALNVAQIGGARPSPGGSIRISTEHKAPWYDPPRAATERR